LLFFLEGAKKVLFLFFHLFKEALASFRLVLYKKSPNNQILFDLGLFLFNSAFFSYF
jgi:hypothetical protein